jgi:hypothetical protein
MTAPKTAATDTRLRSSQIDELMRFSVDVLGGLRHDDGMYCFDRSWADPVLRGRSLRYSIMVLLGLTRHDESGGTTDIDLKELHRSIHTERSALTVGDLGLLLWADVRRNSDLAGETIADLRKCLTGSDAGTDVLGQLEGMEIGWLQVGAAHAMAAGLDASDVFGRIDEEMAQRQTPSGFFVHHRRRGLRKFLPNFATQIYTVLALAETARHGLRNDADRQAITLADRLIQLRRPDAAWPWLYDTRHGLVAEPYELYSVHQDAMAPMALFALAEVTGLERFVDAAVEGHNWCFGSNELGFHFYDSDQRFAHRAIRRSGLADPMCLTGNSAMSLIGGSLPRLDLGRREVNSTCRPYHLGWILEAWSGRQNNHPGYTSS